MQAKEVCCLNNYTLVRFSQYFSAFNLAKNIRYPCKRKGGEKVGWELRRGTRECYSPV